MGLEHGVDRLLRQSRGASCSRSRRGLMLLVVVVVSQGCRAAGAVRGAVGGVVVVGLVAVVVVVGVRDVARVGDASWRGSEAAKVLLLVRRRRGHGQRVQF